MEPVEAVQKSVTRRKAPEQKRRFYGADFKLQIVKKHLLNLPHRQCYNNGDGKAGIFRWQ